MFHDSTFGQVEHSSEIRVTGSTQVLGKKAFSACCLFTGHVPTTRLSRLLLLCWLRILTVRLHEWAGLLRVVILGVFVLLDCVCVEGQQLLMREMEGMILLIFVDVRGQERRRRTSTAICLFTGHVPRRRL